ELSYELTLAENENSMRRVEYNPIAAAGKILFNTIDRVDIGNGTFLPRLAMGADPNLLQTIEQESNNPFLTIKVNGVPVFCKGGNWGMDDAMKRVSREKLEPYFRLHKEENFNMIRNWTGESTEQVFYELADEYGLLVWNDFWLTTEEYNLGINDYNLFMKNATEVVKRFRNHPSIAIWCPRNEGYAPKELEHKLQKLIADEDGTRFYSPNSRKINLRQSGPWDYRKNTADYFHTLADGFNTELGTPSIPTAETMRSFIPEADRWPISDTWYYHDFHSGLKAFTEDLEQRYGNATSLDDFTRKAQFLNYESHRAMFESWNSKLWENASGLLLWMSHPAWPSMVWQTYSWDYETFGSYFGSKKACEPLHIQLNPLNNQVDIINTTRHNQTKLMAKAEIFNLNGKSLAVQKAVQNAVANKKTESFKVEIPTKLPKVYLIRLTLLRNNKVISQNDYWRSDNNESFSEFNHLKSPELTIKFLEKTGNNASFQIINNDKVPALAVKMNLIDASSGQRILPAYFSDGYFNLLPGEKRTLSVEWPIKNQLIKLRVQDYHGSVEFDFH
ncbi:MAG: glycoside hydrolase family 2 TIM barrel-domain containing protein, partial [Bacteroidales bacterium]|nr:glycoside hydrolase family 2 TIM barrel-domain containing protein [Bacteroidales bacterium]